uniref:DUF6887 family protein n=1 Tax=Okeania sp. SIO2F4 TaxID=2607790 RepID=UPI0025EA9DCA|nr:hypothetical protein [Okeania sp. SIO2F4]
MNHPTNFQTMNESELRAYILAHRDNTKAFYALADCLKSKPGRNLSEGDLDRLPEILAEIKQENQYLSQLDINLENIKNKYQILILPSKINNSQEDLELIDTDDAIYLTKLLKLEQLSCANSYDLGLEAKVSNLRSVEIKLGLIWILDKACIPILIVVIVRLIGDKISQSNKNNQNSPQIQAELKIFDNKIESGSVNYHGDVDGFLKVLEGFKNDKKEQK